MQIDLYTKDIPEIFERFRDSVGERHWVKRVAAIKSEIKGQPYLRDYLLEENAIAFVLDKCSDLASRFGRIPPQHTNDRSLYPALRLAAQTMWIVERSSPEQAKGIFRRLHGAFKNPDDMRAIQFELGVATHFVRRGCSISWPEMERSGNFDLMIHGIGPEGLDVECKSVSRDRGRKIHQRDALEFNHLVRQRLEIPAQRLHSGLAVILTVPDRLEKGFRNRQALAERLGRIVMTGKDAALEDGSDVRLSEFDAAEYPHLGPPESSTLRSDVDKITGTQNREVMILGRRNGGALVFVMQSRQDDALLPYIFNSVAEAARNQLSRKRAGMVLVGMDGLSADELLRTAQQDKDPAERPTALRVEVSKFLGGTSTDHLVGVGFLSRDELVPKGGGHVSTGGTAYHFPKRESCFWHDDFSGLFAEQGWARGAS